MCDKGDQLVEEQPMDVDADVDADVSENNVDFPVSEESEHDPAESRKKYVYPTPRSAKFLTKEIVDELKSVFAEKAKVKADDSWLHYMKDDWLDDNNINEYLEMIKRRSDENEGYPSIYHFGCFFYSLLHQKNLKDGGYQAVKHTAMGRNIFNYDFVFFPCEINSHWRLVVLNTQAKTILLYDSLNPGGENLRCLKYISMYLKKEYERVLREEPGAFVSTPPEASVDETSPELAEKRRERGIQRQIRKYFNSSFWTVKIVDPHDIPRQSNSFDCGIFLLQYAEYISRNASLDFTQVHMSYFRMKMAYETIKQALMT